jgi:Fic family protein
LREIDLRELHRLALLRSQPDEAGRYSRHQRAAAGSAVTFPPLAAIPALMGDLAKWLASRRRRARRRRLSPRTTAW